jgi:iron(III) transport system substrate-binding protein
MRTFTIAILAALTLMVSAAEAYAEEVVVYSARKEHLIKPLFDAYTDKTGVEITYTTGKAGALVERLKAEGDDTPADMLITVDAGNLWYAAEQGVLQPVASQALATNIPANLRDPENRWYGLSVRARTIVYNTEAVNPDELAGYADLADPKWKDRLLLRTSKKVYNQSLVASLIEEHGEEKAEEIVRGWVANLAAPPFSSDTKTLEAVAAGVGDVTIVNTYYLGRLLKKNPEMPLAIHWPDQDGAGVHVNVSGAGVVAGADNVEGAKALLEWLSSDEAQALFASLNMEYPANPALPLDPVVDAWGGYMANPMNVAVYGERQAEAIKLMDRAGYK